jgi:hypothetical protein
VLTREARRIFQSAGSFYGGDDRLELGYAATLDGFTDDRTLLLTAVT